MEPRHEQIAANLDRVQLFDWVTRQCRDVTFTELVGGSHTPRIASRRHEVWSVIHGTLGYSHGEIARLFLVHASTVHRALQERERKHLAGAA